MRVGINGFGRIGRLVFRAGLNEPNFDIVAVNDIFPIKMLAHLLKYDSVYGILPNKVESKDNAIIVDGKEIKVFNIKEPSEIPWTDVDVEYVVESTGIFRSRDKAGLHLRGSVKKVIISAPAKGAVDFAVIMGVNEDKYDPSKHHVIDNASCTTNCFAPMVKVLHENFVIKKGLMSTVHAYTNDQRLVDAPHKEDLRRARAAANSIIPTSTGAAKAIFNFFPELKGKLDAIAIRVPVLDGSLIDFNCEVEKSTTVDEVNNAFKLAAENYPKYIEYLDAPVVSSDIIGNSHSMIFDPFETRVIEKNFVKVLAWYDNEYGYACRIVDLIKYMESKK